MTRAAIGHLAAIALGYALGRAHGYFIANYGGHERVKKTKTKVKMVREEGVTIKRGTCERGDDDTVTKNPEQQVREEKWHMCSLCCVNMCSYLLTFLPIMLLQCIERYVILVVVLGKIRRSKEIQTQCQEVQWQE